MSPALKLYAAAQSAAGQPGARKRWRLAAHALATLTDAAAPLRAYATACETHKRADWREAAHALAAAIDPANKRPVLVKPERRPMTLCEFLSKAGGLRDTGCDLKSMGADQWHRRASFRARLVRDDGLALDYAADLAAERGYVAAYASPTMGMGADMADDYHRVSVDALMAAIERELAGTPCYPAESDWAPYVEPEAEDYESMWEETYPAEAA